jgi:uncharacterized protein (DUF486 family)
MYTDTRQVFLIFSTCLFWRNVLLDVQLTYHIHIFHRLLAYPIERIGRNTYLETEYVLISEVIELEIIPILHPRDIDVKCKGPVVHSR